MSENLQKVISSLLSVNTNLWNKVSGIIDDNYIYWKSVADNNLSSLISNDDSNGLNWLDYNETTGKLEVKVPYADANNPGVIRIGQGLTINNGIVSVVASGVVMEYAAVSDVAKSTSGTLTIGNQTFNGSSDVIIDLSKTIELSAVTSIDSTISSATPQLLYTPNGQTAIVTASGIIPTSEEITDTISDSVSGHITTAKAVMNYVSSYVENAATNVSITKSVETSGTTLTWTIDGVSDSLNIEKERWLSNVTYNAETNKLTFTVANSGSFEMDATDLIQDYIAGAGLTKNGSEISLVKDNNADSQFLQIGADTIGLSGISDAITSATSGAIELKLVNSIPSSGDSSYTHPTLVYTDDGETAIVTSNTVIKTSEQTVDEITSTTAAEYIVTASALTGYVNAGLADLLVQVNALRDEISGMNI
jgi:hypothetical protein